MIVFQELENGMQQLEYKVILDVSGACRNTAYDGYSLYMGFRLSIASDVQVRAVNSDGHKHFNAWINLIPDNFAGRVGEKVAWQRDGSHANTPVGLKDSDRWERTTRTTGGLTISSRWLKTCRKSHSQCKSSPGEFIPTRLISTAADRARLCLIEDFPNFPEYATLSHCWGNNAFHTLKRNNLESFKSRIPQEALSQTISDSIKIARDLGILYIWIDSLCIIQDDDSDWMRESSLMSSVYGGSSLNIAASGAVDGRSGCFLQRSHTWKCLVEANFGNRPERFQCVPLRMYYESLRSGPLGKRGWALQERPRRASTCSYSAFYPHSVGLGMPQTNRM